MNAVVNCSRRFDERPPLEPNKSNTEFAVSSDEEILLLAIALLFGVAIHLIAVLGFWLR